MVVPPPIAGGGKVSGLVPQMAGERCLLKGEERLKSLVTQGVYRVEAGGTARREKPEDNPDRRGKQKR